MKKPFLLLEILIGLSLIGMLISLLFSFMVHSIKTGMKIESARAQILERQHFQIRLQDLLISLHPLQGKPPLHLQKFPKEIKESLVFSFDHGVDIDPIFSGHQIGRLYLDEAKHLVFSYSPYVEEKEPTPLPFRKEVLLPHVEEISYQFLKQKIERGEKKEWIWDSLFSKEEKELPPALRIMVKQKATWIPFAFSIPKAKCIPTYEETNF